ncbi:Plastid division regulator MinE [Heracleum sosnowskyi]|uniref:Plastid division regulator MinE n=1 Tax=Heracleum sosnowskyi TaxID=360622 RepID=A0AAD8HYX7_9APIA|nr:Plastid division regulator MinE [Heracleum sosnowskyi]
MAMSVDFMVSASSRPYPSSSIGNSLHPSKVEYSGFLDGGFSGSGVLITYKWPRFDSHKIRCNSKQPPGIAGEFELSSSSISQEAESFLLNARLQMILFSDRCAVSNEAKQKIVSNIVGALSDFVEIESQDKVELSVSTDAALGTIYSVTVPVRRVKPQYQEDDETGTITNIEYKDSGETSGSVDVKFDFYAPDENEFRF